MRMTRVLLTLISLLLHSDRRDADERGRLATVDRELEPTTKASIIRIKHEGNGDDSLKIDEALSGSLFATDQRHSANEGARQ